MCYYDNDWDGYGNSSVSMKSTETCPAGWTIVDGDCDDDNPDVNPSEDEVCNFVDDDCNDLTDEGASGYCTADGVSACEGSVDCSSYSMSECESHTDIGCSVELGRCDDTGEHCAVDSDCPGGDNVCEGASCSGQPPCNQFEDGASCTDNHPGCSWNSTLYFQDSNETCADKGGVWTCSDYEICSNDVDDDGGGADCKDPECQVTASLTDSEVSRYNCLGTNQTGDVGEGNYYCGQAEEDESVGLCCLAGETPVLDPVYGTWSCQDTDPCYPTPQHECGYRYSAANFTDWIGDTRSDGDASEWCVAPSEGRACCEVVQFGKTEYWSNNPGNVKVY